MGSLKKKKKRERKKRKRTKNALISTFLCDTGYHEAIDFSFHYS